VVVPFRGSREELEQLAGTLTQLRLRPGDTVLIVDNSPRRHGISQLGPVSVRPASERHTPGYARNRGAERGSGDWLVFLDADTVPSEDLLDAYFEPPPRERTGVLGGGIHDQPVPGDGPSAARYAYIRGAMSQEDTFRFGEWGFPKTANAAFRRSAFEAVGGFRDDIRTAEDADLCYRMRGAGWEIERREHAAALHRNRATVPSFVVQRFLYGAGGAWLEWQYPGAFPARRRLGLIVWAIRRSIRDLLLAARIRNRDRALWAVFEPLEAVAWEFGRSLPNERPLTAGAWWRAVRRARGPREATRI
jgi:GT2 family glycosyltransferase